MTETMAGYLHKVTYKEQLILCHVIREGSGELKYALLTPALLPFVQMKDVHWALRAVPASRPVAVLIAKLSLIGPNFHQRMWLNDRKVMKVFGPDPSKGRRFNWLPKKTIKGKPIDPLVCLKLHSRYVQKDGSVYDVVVHKEYQQSILAWLCDNLT